MPIERQAHLQEGERRFDDALIDAAYQRLYGAGRVDDDLRQHLVDTLVAAEVVPLSVAESLADAIEAAGHGPHEDEECPACLALAAYRADHPKPSVAELVEHSRELGEGMRVAGDAAVGHLRAAADELREKGTP